MNKVTELVSTVLQLTAPYHKAIAAWVAGVVVAWLASQGWVLPENFSSTVEALLLGLVVALPVYQVKNRL